MKKFKKQITLVTFTRFFNPTTYLLCSSSILSKNQIFISNYAFKYLYMYVLPKNFLNSRTLNSKLSGYTNNFLGIIQFKNKKDIYSYYMTLDGLNKLKLGFIKYKSLYFVGNSSIFQYLDTSFLVYSLNFTLLNYIYKFYIIIKQVNKI